MSLVKGLLERIAFPVQSEDHIDLFCVFFFVLFLFLTGKYQTPNAIVLSHVFVILCFAKNMFVFLNQCTAANV